MHLYMYRSYEDLNWEIITKKPYENERNKNSDAVSDDKHCLPLHILSQTTMNSDTFGKHCCPDPYVFNGVNTVLQNIVVYDKTCQSCSL